MLLRASYRMHLRSVCLSSRTGWVGWAGLNPLHQEAMSPHGASQYCPGEQYEAPLKTPGSTAQVLHLEVHGVPYWDTDRSAPS